MTNLSSTLLNSLKTPLGQIIMTKYSVSAVNSDKRFFFFLENRTQSKILIVILPSHQGEVLFRHM